MNATERAVLVGALIDRYTKADVKERLMLLAMMPSGRFLKDMLDFDLAVAKIVETDERLLRLKVVSRATAKDHPILVAGENSPDPLTKAVAGYMRARLSVDLPKTYSRMPSTFRWELLGQ